MEQTYYRKGFGLRKEIKGELEIDYHSRLVDEIRASDNTLTVGGLTFHLADEFGFCYGVDRAVEYAYESRRKFPDKRIVLVGEIIHNPHVNRRLVEMGIEILHPGDDGRFDFSDITPDDVVIIPAFGVRVADFNELNELGCVLVDTTCGSVLNVWKRVQMYSREGFTSIVHGKYFHEETKATVSQVGKHGKGAYLIVRDMNEAEIVCKYIEEGGDSSELLRRFPKSVSSNFDPEKHLQKIGVANQTTMLSSESLAIAHRFRKALAERYGERELGEHFKTFDTICSATQERQDAVLELIKKPLDTMLVIGGYNSSNTNHLAKICAKTVRTYHISDASCIDPEHGTINHKVIGTADEIVEEPWPDDAKEIGVTAGASTPNNKIGEAIARILDVKGLAIPA